MSEMTLAQAVNELGKMGNFARAIAKASEVGNFLASLIQQEHELKQKLEHVRAEVTAAEGARDRATAEAIAIRQAANDAAAAAVAASKDKAVSLVDEAMTKVQEFQALAARANDEFLASEKLRDEARRDAAAAGAELERIRADIEEAKAEARRRFGG